MGTLHSKRRNRTAQPGCPKTLEFSWLTEWSRPPVDEPTFLLRVSQSSDQSLQRRQDSAIGFLNSNGDIVQRCQSASEYVLSNGRLASGSLSYSTSPAVRNARFGGTRINEAITTFFSVSAGSLSWKNATFEGGAARFCARQSEPLLVVFSGPLPEGYSNVTLRALESTSGPKNQYSPYPG